MRWGVRVSWAQQMSLWLIKNTTTAGYWARRKHLNHGDVNTHKKFIFHSLSSTFDKSSIIVLRLLKLLKK